MAEARAAWLQTAPTWDPARLVFLDERGVRTDLVRRYGRGQRGERVVDHAPDGTDAPMCQDTRLGGLNDLLASAVIGHDALVDLSRKEAFEAPDDLVFGPAIGGTSGDVVAGGLVESHADDDGAIKGGVGVAVAAPIEPVPAGGHPGRGRERTRTAELREGGFRTNPVGIVAEDDQQFGRGVGAHTEALTEGR